MEKLNYKLAEKAYKINLDKISEGFILDPIICYAQSIGEAKTKLLRIVAFDDLKLKYSYDELTFITIPVVRYKEADKYDFEGAPHTLNQIDEILATRDRHEVLNRILEDKNIQYCYIKKGSYYRPNHCGYTEWKDKAGVYTKEEAVSHARSVREIEVIPINVKEHNELIDNQVKDLLTRIIIQTF